MVHQSVLDESVIWSVAQLLSGLVPQTQIPEQ